MSVASRRLAAVANGSRSLYAAIARAQTSSRMHAAQFCTCRVFERSSHKYIRVRQVTSSDLTLQTRRPWTLCFMSSST